MKVIYVSHLMKAKDVVTACRAFKLYEARERRKEFKVVS